MYTRHSTFYQLKCYLTCLLYSLSQLHIGNIVFLRTLKIVHWYHNMILVLSCFASKKTYPSKYQYVYGYKIEIKVYIYIARA